MWPNTRKERLSLAYLTAVAAHAGFQIVEPNVDFDSIDAKIISDLGRRPELNLQVKATSTDVVRETDLAYPLRVKNFNDLHADVMVPRLLVVVVLPENEAEWIGQTEEDLRIRRCGYWMSLRGLPDTPNEETVTVHLPRIQIFESVQLTRLMEMAARGEPL